MTNRRRPIHHAGSKRDPSEGGPAAAGAATPALTRRRGVTAFAGALIALAVIGLPSRAPTAAGPVGPHPGRVRATTAMGQARAAHSATALMDGRILIVGGFTGDEAQLAGTELFDPQRERFEAIAQPGIPRQSHTATRLLDGKVLIAGGIGARNQYLDTAELYDPTTGRFSLTGRLTAARSNHEAVLLEDGRVLLVGGVGTGWTFLASAEIYDPRTGVFTATGGMGEPREGHAAVRLRDGRVLVTGGHRGRRDAMVVSRTAEIYDVAAGRFMPTGAMMIRRHKHDAVTLGDGRVLVLGGADERDNEGTYRSVEAFDPVHGTFRAANPMRLARYKHRGTSFELADGRLLLTGGAPQMEEYDPASGASQLVGGAAQLAGQFSAAAPLPDGRFLITGGYGLGRGPRATAWIYEPSADGPAPGR